MEVKEGEGRGKEKERTCVERMIDVMDTLLYCTGCDCLRGHETGFRACAATNEIRAEIVEAD
jgi:hypothetical protein